MIIFGLFVPTGDNYSDLWLSMNYFYGTYTPAAKFRLTDCKIVNETVHVCNKTGTKVPIIAGAKYVHGFVTFLPVLLTFTITSIHWYQTEKSSKIR